MRSIWRVAINFGMVTIPVKLYTATEQKDGRFHLVHEKDRARIVEKRFCSKEDVEVPWDRSRHPARARTSGSSRPPKA